VSTRRYDRGLFVAVCLLWLALGLAGVPRAAEFECAADEMSGLAAADGDAILSLVCAELRRLTLGSGDFGVSLREQADHLELAVRDRQNGRTRATSVDALADVVAIAPRLAVALVKDEPLEASRPPRASRERAHQERRTKASLTVGYHRWSCGWMLEPGPFLSIAVEKPFGHLEAVGEATAAPGLDSAGGFRVSSFQGALSVGGRIRSGGDGGGMVFGSGVSLLGQRGHTHEGPVPHPGASGPGWYLELGLASHRGGKLGVRVRADRPFFAMTRRYLLPASTSQKESVVSIGLTIRVR
jgi:hypothetical protein